MLAIILQLSAVLTISISTLFKSGKDLTTPDGAQWEDFNSVEKNIGFGEGEYFKGYYSKFSTWFSTFYLIIGVLLPVIEIDLTFNGDVYCKVALILIGTAILSIIAIYISKILADKVTRK